MKKLINYLFILNICFCFAQKETTISQALNLASKQSMLCERLAKEKVFKVTNPNNYDIEQKLGVSLIQFERNISRLQKMVLPETTLFLIKTTEMLWFSYKKSLLDKDNISTIKTMEYNKIMFYYCEKVFTDILKYAKKNKAYPYNTSLENFSDAYIASNKIKQLSQKLSLFHNAYYSKVNDYDSINYNSIISDIDTAIVTITKIEKSNPAIDEKTKKINQEWNALKTELQNANTTNFEFKEKYPKPDYVLKKSNELLKDADLLTRHYKEQNETN